MIATDDRLTRVQRSIAEVEADGRPAVKLSDNYSKALGPPSEIERYRKVFGTAGISNVPLVA